MAVVVVVGWLARTAAGIVIVVVVAAGAEGTQLADSLPVVGLETLGVSTAFHSRYAIAVSHRRRRTLAEGRRRESMPIAAAVARVRIR